MTAYATEPQPVDVRPYLPLVEKIARGFLRRMPSHVQAEELVSAGMVGLLEAAHRYDPGRGIRFDKFASSRVRGAILDELRRRDLMARDARTEEKKLQQAIARLTSKLNREPEEEEIAAELEIDVLELRDRFEKLTPVQTVGLSEYLEPQSKDGSPSENLSRVELVEAITSALEQLKPRHQQVLTLYYYEELTLKDIGTILDVTESRVSQILTEATLKLRTHLQRLGIRGQDDV
ncbi:MAG: FliA/WhiG family RNA polymerase sigma factor [Myxococcota bacterium]